MNPDDLLRLAAAGDNADLSRLRQRVEKGEPAGYVAGFIVFRGRRFAMDPRAYVTDPEATNLIDVILREGDCLEAGLGRPLRVLEFGTGAATLALSVALERPGWTVSGLDVDPMALCLAEDNARSHGVELELFESDYLSAWPPERSPPDLLFGDPPWGSDDDVYDDPDALRNAAYYHQMPALAAFPTGGRTGVHDQLIRRVQAARWPSLIVLNFGVIPEELILKSARPLAAFSLNEPKPGMRILVGRI